jgi:hypothetical protein
MNTTRVLTYDDGNLHSYLSVTAASRASTYARRGFTRCRWCMAMVSPLVVKQLGDGVCPNCGSDDWSRPCR